MSEVISIPLDPGITFDVKPSDNGRNLIIAVEGEVYVLVPTTARLIAAALLSAADEVEGR